MTEKSHHSHQCRRVVKDVRARRTKRHVVVKRQEHEDVNVNVGRHVNVVQESQLTRVGHVHVVRTVDVRVAVRVARVVPVRVTTLKTKIQI
jgi:hypothetical protein